MKKIISFVLVLFTVFGLFAAPFTIKDNYWGELRRVEGVEYLDGERAWDNDSGQRIISVTDEDANFCNITFREYVKGKKKLYSICLDYKIGSLVLEKMLNGEYESVDYLFDDKWEEWK